MSEALREADARGEVALPEPEYCATAIVAYAEGVVLLAKAMNDPKVVLRLAPAAMSLLIDRRATGS